MGKPIEPHSRMEGSRDWGVEWGGENRKKLVKGLKLLVSFDKINKLIRSITFGDIMYHS